MLAGIVVIGTGIVMMVRIDTPLWPQNAYLLTDPTWGLIYVLHGLGSGPVRDIDPDPHLLRRPSPTSSGSPSRWCSGTWIGTVTSNITNPERWVVSRESTKG